MSFYRIVFPVTFGAFLISAFPSSTRGDEKPTLVVYDLKRQTDALADGDAVALSELMRSAITASGRYYVVGREEMDQIRKEAGFQASDECRKDANATSCYIELGGALGAKFIITGSIGRFGTTYSVTVKFLDMATTRAVNSVSKECKSCTVDDLGAVCREAGLELIGAPVPPSSVYKSQPQPAQEAWTDEKVQTAVQAAVQAAMQNKEDPVIKLKTSTEWFGMRGYGGYTPGFEEDFDEGAGGGGEISFFTVRWESFYWTILRFGGGVPTMGYWGMTFGVPFSSENGKNELRLGFDLTLLFGYVPILSGPELSYVRHVSESLAFELGAQAFIYPTLVAGFLGFRL